jgi:hypothetical protein
MVSGSLRMPNAMKEWQSRAKVGFRTVERVWNDIGLVVLRGRRIKPEAHIEICVLLRGNLKSEQVRFEGENIVKTWVYRRIRIVFGGLRGIKCRKGVGCLE